MTLINVMENIEEKNLYLIQDEDYGKTWNIVGDNIEKLENLLKDILIGEFLYTENPEIQEYIRNRYHIFYQTGNFKKTENGFLVPIFQKIASS